jgi:hypothetical protein
MPSQLVAALIFAINSTKVVVPVKRTGIDSRAIRRFLFLRFAVLPRERAKMNVGTSGLKSKIDKVLKEVG